MKSTSNHAQIPVRGVWLRFLVLIPVLVVLVLASRAYIQTVCWRFDAWTPVYMQDANFDDCDLSDVVIQNSGVVKAVSITHGKDGSACVTFEAVSEGKTEAYLAKDLGKDETDFSRDLGQDEGDLAVWDLRVQDGAIFEGADFTGWQSIHICICIFLAILAGLFASVVIQLWRHSWYGYKMVACGGGLIFTLFQLAMFVMLAVRGSLLNFTDLALEITSMSDWFVLLTFGPMGIMALLVSFSNISLIRHEGRRPVNLLGIAVSVFWLAVMFFWFHWGDAGAQMALSYEAFKFVDSLVSVAITFGECLLLSTMVCAWLASLHVPKQDADYIVVLGCGIRADGTPSPLLAGRVDKARSFDEAHISAGGAPATFVPSGGQGPDEVMSEAQSMRNYLVQKGVAPERVVMEDRSTTTRENMAFSRAVIQNHAGCETSKLSIVFSTTNYHVFRGYVCAHQAGMVVEGVGSKTRAYFWPNAFLREFSGLLVAQWKSILYTYAILAIIYVIAEYMLLID